MPDQTEIGTYLIFQNINAYAELLNGISLRSYQSEAGAAIYRAALSGGGNFSVMFPRQSGKNELEAQLEAALLSLNFHSGGEIMKVTPTYVKQSSTSRRRLAAAIERSKLRLPWSFAGGNSLQMGRARLELLSGNKNASIVGATASILLEVDEAQNIALTKYDRDISPMAASTNAPRIFWGTAWDDSTLLYRAISNGHKAEREGGPKQVFRVTADEVGREVPSYAAFVADQVEQLGRDHPMIRTQFYCEEITDETGMFNSRRLRMIQGTHAPQDAPVDDARYRFYIDMAGSDELSSEEKRAKGFYDTRDATVVTMIMIEEPEDEAQRDQGFIWKVVGRRYYRNVESAKLKEYISKLIEIWNPEQVTIDNTGIGFDMSVYLQNKFGSQIAPFDICAIGKTRMGFGMMSLTGSGRWQEYKVEGQADYDYNIPFKQGETDCEIIDDPALLQHRFLQQLRYCRIESSSPDGKNIKWGVPDGARDPETGNLIHDDLVMSAALAALDDYEMTCGDTTFAPIIYTDDYPGKEFGMPRMTISGVYIHKDGTPIRSGWYRN